MSERTIVDYANELKAKNEMVIILTDLTEHKLDYDTQDITDVNAKYIGKIKEVLADAIILDKGKYEEGAVLIKNIVSIRKWTSR